MQDELELLDASVPGEAADTLLPLLHSALAQAVNPMVLTDARPGPDGPRIVYANPAFCRMTGYSAPELLGQNPRILQGPQTDPLVIAELRECLREGRIFRGSTINYRKDGSPYTVEWNISPVRNADGLITHYLSVQQHISVLVAAQRVSQLLAQALDAAQDAVLITDAQGVIEFANQGFEGVTGYSAAEVLGRTPALLHPKGELAAGLNHRLWRTLQQGKTWRATLTNRHKSGALIHCDTTVTPLRDPSGTIRHFVATFKDLTERVRAERLLREEATHDALTGLLNRRAGELALEAIDLAAREDHSPFCVLMCDIDHFKRVNDNWGHPAGDGVLKGVAQALVGGIRATDRAVRWGGEEFLLVLPHCALTAAQQHAETLREQVAQTTHPGVGPVTLSIGVAQMGSGDSLADLLTRVDHALYRAKQEGRNRVCIADDEPADAP